MIYVFENMALTAAVWRTDRTGQAWELGGYCSTGRRGDTGWGRVGAEKMEGVVSPGVDFNRMRRQPQGMEEDEECRLLWRDWGGVWGVCA